MSPQELNYIRRDIIILRFRGRMLEEKTGGYPDSNAAIDERIDVGF